MSSTLTCLLLLLLACTRDRGLPNKFVACMQSARWFLKLAPDDARPYNALTFIAVLPLFSQTLSQE